ncbi:MAG TPA: NAD(+)/NADH kinase, partial [bacterium]|nr:NAD(+)/NADH kinase [bacterium]
MGLKVGVVVNQKKHGAAELLAKLHSWLAKRDAEVLDTTNNALEEVLKEASLIICLGGDGTLLSVADQMKEPSIPVLGVNLGSLGFLTEVKEGEIFEELNAFFSGSA